MNTCPNGIELKLDPHSDGIRRNDRIKNTLEGCHLNRRRSSELPTTPSRFGNASSCEDAISSSANVRFTGSPVRVNGLICHLPSTSRLTTFTILHLPIQVGPRNPPGTVPISGCQHPPAPTHNFQVSFRAYSGSDESINCRKSAAASRTFKR
jgi:hypothetical protein